jgi:hypothetical protein
VFDAVKWIDTNFVKGVTLFGHVNRPMLFSALKSEAAFPSVTLVFICHAECSNIPEDSNAGMLLKV